MDRMQLVLGILFAHSPIIISLRYALAMTIAGNKNEITWIIELIDSRSTSTINAEQYQLMLNFHQCIDMMESLMVRSSPKFDGRGDTGNPHDSGGFNEEGDTCTGSVPGAK